MRATAETGLVSDTASVNREKNVRADSIQTLLLAIIWEVLSS